MKNLLLLSILVGYCSACVNNTTPWPTPSWYWTTRPTPSWTTRPTAGPPQNNSCSLESYDPCLRHIRQDKNDDFDWTLHSGSTISSDTGPSGDHTTGHGKYYYTEASWPRKQGDRARLTIYIKTNYAACFFFHYHMFGDDMGTLRIYVDHRLTWQLSGNQGNQWIKGTLPVRYPGYHVIHIDGIVGPSFASDIALDDLGYQEFRYMGNSECMVTPSCANPHHNPRPPTTYPTWRPTTYPTWRPSTYPTWRPNGTIYPSWRPTWRPTTYTANPPGVQCGVPSIPTSRVIGGQDARLGAWPWQVGLYAWGTTFMCGGSLISPQFVVTAAHCIFPNARYVVVLGDNKRNVSEGWEQRIPAYKTIVHPGWNPSTIDADIAIIKLARPAMINDYVKPVCLPPANDYLWPGQRCYITGWGKIKHPGGAHNILQQAVLPVVGRHECQAKLSGNSSSSNSSSHGLTITDNMVCGGERGSIKSGCHGDSGGPYVCQRWQDGRWRWVLQGAVSWGSPRCDALHRYTVFARVGKFRYWIDQQLRYQ